MIKTEKRCKHENLEAKQTRRRYRCADCKQYFFMEKGELKPYKCSAWTWISVPFGDKFRKKRVQWHCKCAVTHFHNNNPVCNEHYNPKPSAAELKTIELEKLVADREKGYEDEYARTAHEAREAAQAEELRNIEPTDSIGGVYIW